MFWEQVCVRNKWMSKPVLEECITHSACISFVQTLSASTSLNHILVLVMIEFYSGLELEPNQTGVLGTGVGQVTLTWQSVWFCTPWALRHICSPWVVMVTCACGRVAVHSLWWVQTWWATLLRQAGTLRKGVSFPFKEFVTQYCHGCHPHWAWLYW